jgi:uncharacterized membrane protein
MNWDTFFGVLGTASGTLALLLFVGVSFHDDKDNAFKALLLSIVATVLTAFCWGLAT